MTVAGPRVVEAAVLIAVAVAHMGFLLQMLFNCCLQYHREDQNIMIVLTSWILCIKDKLAVAVIVIVAAIIAMTAMIGGVLVGTQRQRHGGMQIKITYRIHKLLMIKEIQEAVIEPK